MISEIIRPLLLITWIACMAYIYHELILAILILIPLLALPYALGTNLLTPTRTREQYLNNTKSPNIVKIPQNDY